MLRRLLQLLGRHPLEGKALGRAGERAAARHLKQKGYRILGRNLQVSVGEADLLCMAPDRRTIVLVEVKTRLRGSGRSALGEVVAPEASVHAHKRRKLRAVMGALTRANRWDATPRRIDVVAVEWPARGGRPQVRHHEGIST